MQSIEISGKLRESVGKTNTNKLRKDDNVPCIIYGGEKIIHFYAHENDFRKDLKNVGLIKSKVSKYFNDDT